MVEKYISILKIQLQKLDEKDFDFEAWKMATVIVLNRIFGPRDVKIRQLENIRVEYGSSWSMRAVSGSFDPVLSARKQGGEIVRVAIEELELYGEEVISPCGELVDESLSKVLKVDEYRKLEKMLEDTDEMTRSESLTKFFGKLSKDELVMVLTRIVSAQ